MSKPMSRAEMKDWVNETWQKCQEQEPVTRPWVGLTDEEIDQAAEQSDNYASFIAGVLFAQDKLEEKNGG